MGGHRQNGFTLVELMIVVLIVAILATIAYPVYTSQVREARRADAKSLLMRAANREQQYYASQHKYTDDLSELGLADSDTGVKTDNGAYKVSASMLEDDNQTFEITADALGDQEKDDCTTFTIDQTGQKTATESGCW